MSNNEEDTNATITETEVAPSPVVEQVSSKKSYIWDHFTKIAKEDGGKPDKIACNYCGMKYAYSSSHGTSTYAKHLRNCSKYPFNKDKRQKILSFREEENKLVTWKFDQSECRQALAKMIILDELPFRFVEREGFRYFMSVVQPRFQCVSRTTIARDCMELYASLKKDLKKQLANTTHRICLTTDTWTSLQNMSYIVLTVHFVDNDWKLQKRILNFSVISSHKGVAIGQAIESCMLQWSIENVCTMTVDNASSNDTAIAHLKKKLSKKNAFVLDGEFFHMRCCAHIVNLIVREGIKEVEDSIKQIRGAVRYIRSSPQRAQQFKICCEQEKIISKCQLCLDVPTRWNYTYLMLNTALKFEKAFERLDELEPNFGSDLKGGVPTDKDWDNARILTKILKVFYDITKRLSGSLYVTANVYFHEVCAIEQLLCDWAKNKKDLHLSVMAVKMKEKFDKYWGNIEKINMMLLIAAMLDPRYKLQYITFCYKRIYDKEKVDELEKKIRELVNRMYRQYEAFENKSLQPTNSTQFSNEMEVDIVENEEGDLLKSIQSDFLKHLEEQNKNPKSEVDRYLDEGLVKDGSNFEILSWWKLNCSRYPILSLVARDVLAIPVSTVASESAFSTGGRVLDQFRSSLTPKIVECLICGQDWLRSSSIPIEVEERLDELSEIEAAIIEDPELVSAFSQSSVLS